MSTDLLELNKASLIFFPSPNLVLSSSPSFPSPGLVVQVMIQTPKHASPAINEIVSFFLAQRDITKTVENVLLAHILTPLPKRIVLKGEGYILHGRRQEWKYGKRISLGWGGDLIHKAEEKWVFVFEVDGVDAGEKQ